MPIGLGFIQTSKVIVYKTVANISSITPASPLVCNGTLTFSVAVSNIGFGPTPTGTVTIVDSSTGIVYGSGMLNGVGVANIIHNPPNVGGLKNFIAVYNLTVIDGRHQFAPCQSAAIPYTIYTGGTATTCGIVVTGPMTYCGHNNKLVTINVTSGMGTPTGLVTLSANSGAGSVNIGAMNLSGGSAVFTIPIDKLVPSTWTLVANYGGDGACFSPSTTTLGGLIVNNTLGTATVLTVHPSDVPGGTDEVYSGSVSCTVGGVNHPTSGTAYLYALDSVFNILVLASGSVDISGNFSITVPYTAWTSGSGSYTVYVYYIGNNCYGGSFSIQYPVFVEAYVFGGGVF